MRVLFLPYDEGNPYQRLLAQSLRKEGAKITAGRYFRLFPLLRNRCWQYDIVHLHWQHGFLVARSGFKTLVKSITFLFEILLFKLVGTRIVWTVHNLKNHENVNIKAEIFFSKLIARLCHTMIALCEAAKRRIQETYGVKNASKIVVIHHGHFLHYPNVISTKKAREVLGFSSRDRVFLLFGNIRPYKGLLEFIDAFQKLRTETAKLMIVGRPLNEQIAKQIRAKTKGHHSVKTVFGFVPDNQIQTYMNAADVSVSPYKDILASSAIILAMSFGKAVIAPAIGCIPETLDSIGSFLYNPNSREGLSLALKRAANQGVDVDKMGKHNLELVKELKWDRIGKLTYMVYKRAQSYG